MACDIRDDRGNVAAIRQKREQSGGVTINKQESGVLTLLQKRRQGPLRTYCPRGTVINLAVVTAVAAFRPWFVVVLHVERGLEVPWAVLVVCVIVAIVVVGTRTGSGASGVILVARALGFAKRGEWFGGERVFNVSFVSKVSARDLVVQLPGLMHIRTNRTVWESRQRLVIPMRAIASRGMRNARKDVVRHTMPLVITVFLALF